MRLSIAVARSMGRRPRESSLRLWLRGGDSTGGGIGFLSGVWRGGRGG